MTGIFIEKKIEVFLFKKQMQNKRDIFLGVIFFKKIISKENLCSVPQLPEQDSINASSSAPNSTLKSWSNKIAVSEINSTISVLAILAL